MTVVNITQQSLSFDGSTIAVNGEEYPIENVRSVVPDVTGARINSKTLTVVVTTTDGQAHRHEVASGSLGEVNEVAKANRPTMDAIFEAIHSGVGSEPGTLKVMGLRYDAYRKGNDYYYNPNRKAGKAPRWTPVMRQKVKDTWQPA